MKILLELSEQRSFPINIHFFIVSAGNPSIAYDVAINPEFYKKTENSKLFLSFLLTVVMEGLKDKYSLSLQTEGKEGYNFNHVGSVSPRDSDGFSQLFAVLIDLPMDEPLQTLHLYWTGVHIIFNLLNKNFDLVFMIHLIAKQSGLILIWMNG